MTATLPNNQNTPFGFNIDGYVYPQFLTWNRAPTSNDVYNPGTRILDTTTNLIWETRGAGVWLDGGVSHATTSIFGSVTLTDDSFPVATKAYADAIAVAGAPVAGTATQGIVTLATDVEAVAGTPSTLLTALAVQPSNLAAVFAAPPAIGGTTPAAAAVTTLGFTTMTGTAGGSLASGGVAITIGTDASNDAVSIGTAGTRTLTLGSVTSTSSTVIHSGTGALNIGTSIAKTITIGNTTGATAVVVNSGTGGIALVSTGSGDITAASADTLLLDSAGVLELNSSAGVISIGNDSVSQNINIGTAGTRAITIGSTAAAVTLTSGGSGVTIDGITTSVYAIGPSTTTGTITIGGTAQTGNIVLGSSSGISTVKIAAGAGASTVTIAEGTAGANTVSILNGNIAALGTVNILSGTGAAGAAGSVLSMAANTRVATIGLGNVAPSAARTTTVIGGNSAQNDTLNIMSGAPSANTSVVSILNGAATGTATQTLNILSGASNSTAMNLNILNGNVAAGTVTFNIANSATTSVTTANWFTGAAAHVLNVGSTSMGNITFTQASGSTFSIKGSAGTVNLAADAAANVVTLGSLTGAAELKLQSGTGGLSLATGATTAGLVAMTPFTVSVASPNVTTTKDTRVLTTTWTGFTTAAAATQDFTIVSNKILTTSGIIATIANLNASTNGALMSIVGITQAAGSVVVSTVNNGGGALGAGDNVIITLWIVS